MTISKGVSVGENLRYAVRVVSRIMNVFVVLPASCAAVMFALSNNFSFYEFANSAARYFKALPQSTSIEVWAAGAASQASMLYWALVIFGVIVHILVMGPRGLFMMHPSPEKAAADNT